LVGPATLTFKEKLLVALLGVNVDCRVTSAGSFATYTVAEIG
jgi:hypothetical protein